MGVIRIDGTMQIGPTNGGDNAFPSGSVNVPFSATPSNPKSFQASVGDVRNLNSPSAFTALAGIGTTVAKADTLYLKTQTPVSVRITQAQSGGGTITSTKRICGLFIAEFPSGEEVTLLEIQGSGIIEYYATGQQ